MLTIVAVVVSLTSVVVFLSAWVRRDTASLGTMSQQWLAEERAAHRR